jgi:hypothetical protein
VVAAGQQKKARKRRIARARWRSFGEYAFLEDSRYASQLKMCGAPEFIRRSHCSRVRQRLFGML